MIMKSKRKALPESPFVEGDGVPPEREGLYWVTDPTLAGRNTLMIAVVEGVAPFLRVKLVNPFEDGAAWTPSAKGTAALIWRGEITKPEVRG